MSAEEIAAVEARANAIVLQNAPVETRLMAIEDAMQSGAMALFGEKYGDEVRVVSHGRRWPQRQQGVFGRALRRHACRAHRRHRPRQGHRRDGVASGVRRIEALTADAARAYLNDQDARLKEVAAALHVRPEDAAERVKALVEERKQLERQLADAKKQIAMGGGGKDAGAGHRRNRRPQVPQAVGLRRRMKDLKAMADDGRAKIGSGIVAIVNIRPTASSASSSR